MKFLLACCACFFIAHLACGQAKYTLLNQDGLTITYSAKKQKEITDMAGNPMTVYMVRFVMENSLEEPLKYEVELKLKKFSNASDIENWPVKTIRLSGTVEPGCNTADEVVQHIYKECTDCLGSHRLVKVSIRPADERTASPE